MTLPDLKTLASVVALSAAAFGTPALAQDAPELTQPENWRSTARIEEHLSLKPP